MQTLLTQREAATVMRLSQRTLERLRGSGGGPRFVMSEDEFERNHPGRTAVSFGGLGLCRSIACI